MKRPQFRFACAALAALLASAALLVHVSTAQHATPTVDGSIGLTEYGTSQNQQTNGGTTWYVTWDETNLYVGLSGANTTEGAVVYVDADRPLTNAGTNADGSLAGQTYDSTNFSALPFRADFVTYYKDGYREYRTADGAGGWSAPTTGFGAYASNGSTVRELSIPWSAITGAGRPDSFNFFAYATSAGGFVYGEVPPENPDGFVGTSATATNFYYVASTANGASTKPFAQDFAQTRTFVVNSTADTADAAAGDGACDAGGAVCTLRAAVQEANAVASLDVINFNIPAATDPGCNPLSLVCTISPASALPTVTDPVFVDGYTQPTASANTLATGDDAALKVELNGTSAGAGVEGLNITGGTTTVRGLVVNRFGGRGIELGGGDFNVIAGCFVGTDPGGTLDQGNGQAGVYIQGLVGGSDTNRVGGTLPAERNLISGNNGDGVGGAGGGA
ncbi:MAG TPA: CSLREA domain-containing protein, partial [Pyrinomonadaceae bacterium]